MSARNARRIAREMRALKAGVRRGVITLEEAGRRSLQLGEQAAADEAIRTRRGRGRAKP